IGVRSEVARACFRSRRHSYALGSGLCRCGCGVACHHERHQNTEDDKIKDMEENVYLDKLARRDIKPTAIRLIILKNMMEAGRAVSLLDLEILLDTVDKSTISRTIALFLSHHLIHSIDDGSGSLKYAVCDNSCNCVIQDLHSHFY